MIHKDTIMHKHTNTMFLDRPSDIITDERELRDVNKGTRYG